MGHIIIRSQALTTYYITEHTCFPRIITVHVEEIHKVRMTVWIGINENLGLTKNAEQAGNMVSLSALHWRHAGNIVSFSALHWRHAGKIFYFSNIANNDLYYKAFPRVDYHQLYLIKTCT